MKTVSCWFPALWECEGLGFIPPSQATRSVGVLEWLLELEGEEGEKVSVGKG